MKSVFISYSSRDKEFARKLASDLSSFGIRSWIDEWEIRVGDSIVEKINEGIQLSDYLLVILSKASAQSKWVREEITAAFAKNPKEANRVLIPILIDDVEIPLFIRNIKYVDFTKKKYNEGVKEIVSGILDTPPSEVQKPTQILNAKDLAKEVAVEVANILNVSPEGIREENSFKDEINPKLVFVIISFKADMEPIFEGIKVAGEAHGLQVERVKDVQGDYKITNKIIQMIHQARLIVTDLSHERPNVYFELGYARGLGKTIITTAREGTKLHFDVKDWTCTFYTDSRILERHLLERFAYELGEFKGG